MSSYRRRKVDEHAEVDGTVWEIAKGWERGKDPKHMPGEAEAHVREDVENSWSLEVLKGGWEWMAAQLSTSLPTAPSRMDGRGKMH
ncbi:hypothetical protein E2C01_002177 [Portunus trituberculatus]|uniref:Uncharacterized protein n=1 Tax=Portunus trituberculatus TaxID=210409 RepID=A0A5B7CIQ1_PORTR|nr:hypothetical protein [Portunus trituberculatus]